MSSDTSVPDDILDAVRFIKEAEDQTLLTRTDKDNLNRAKLRIAFWACRSESVVPTRDNLVYVLGSDAPEIMGNYDRYLERESDRQKAEDKAIRERAEKRKKAKKGDSGFWENA